MIDLMVILLIVFIILLAIQIMALVRIRYLILRLKSLFIDRKRAERQRFNRTATTTLSQLRKCQFCKHRQTFIQANIHGGEEDFYYRCAYHDVEVYLAHTCSYFEAES